jgi:hypothetical protein
MPDSTGRRREVRERDGQKRSHRARRLHADLDDERRAALATDVRKSVLDAYADRISTRGSTLDARAETLRSGEDRLRESEARICAREGRVAELERSLRLEMAGFLENLQTRERQVSEMEVACATALREARQTAAGAERERAALQTRIESAGEELAHVAVVRRELRSVRQALAAARVAQGDIEAGVATRRAEFERLAHDRDEVDRLQRRLAAQEREGLRRERELSEEESQQAARERTLREMLSKVESLEASIAALRELVRRECARQRGREGMPFASLSEARVAAMESREIAHVAADLALYLSSEAESVRRGRDELVLRAAELASREGDVLQKESDLRAREIDVQGTVEQAQRLSREAQGLMDRAAAEAAAAAAASSGVEHRGELIRAQEAALLDKQSDVGSRASEVRRLQAALKGEEVRIERSRVLLAAREAAVDREYREAGRRQAGADTTGAAATSSGAAPPAVGTGAEPSENGDSRAGAYGASGIAQSPEAPRAGHASRTGHPARPRDTPAAGPAGGGVQQAGSPLEGEAGAVRKRLTFQPGFPAPPRDAATGRDAATSAGGAPPPFDPPLRDDASEAAAEELVGELLAARSTWKDRVGRLEAVLHAMRPSAVQHGVVSLVDGVRARLAEIRAGAEAEAVSSRADEPASELFAKERAVQLGWGEVLRSELDTIREIQTGLLLAADQAPGCAQADPTVHRRLDEAWQDAAPLQGSYRLAEDVERRAAPAPTAASTGPSDGDDDSADNSLTRRVQEALRGYEALSAAAAPE